MTYFGYPENLEEYKKAIEIEKTSMHDSCLYRWLLLPQGYRRGRHPKAYGHYTF